MHAISKENWALIRSFWPAMKFDAILVDEWNRALGGKKPDVMELAIRHVYRTKSGRDPGLSWFTAAVREILREGTGQGENTVKRITAEEVKQVEQEHEEMRHSIAATHDDRVADAVRYVLMVYPASLKSDNPWTWPRTVVGLVWAALQLDVEELSDLTRAAVEGDKSAENTKRIGQRKAMLEQFLACAKANQLQGATP